jgi:hypothetical protein
MRTVTLALSGIVCAVLYVSTASAQAVATDLRQPASTQQAAAEQDNYLSFATTSGTAATPGNQPPAPAKAGEAATEKKADEAEKKDEEKKDDDAKEEDKPWKLFNGCWLQENRIDVRGWVDQGYTWNPSNPPTGFNGPVGYNDRANEYMLNQVYMIAERVTKVENDCGTDIGGRVDFLYGEDSRYTDATGLDNQWNSGGFYGGSMPQAYVDLAVNKWIFRAGHFYAPCGNETAMAPDNFFYSHTYAFLYGEPTTLSGGEAMYKLNDRWTVNLGVDTGWNNWIDPTDKINYFGGGNWNSEDGKTTLALEAFFGNTDEINPDATRFLQNIVLTQKIGEKWRFAFEANVGYDNGANVDPVNGGFTHGDWLSFASYLMYDVNPCWSYGFRWEWISDDDATIIQQVGPPTAGPYRARYNDFTWGVNWKPHQSKNVLVRSELRYDTASDSLPAGQRPFDSGEKNNQFLWATDLIVRF